MGVVDLSMNKSVIRYLQYAVNGRRARFRKPPRKSKNGPPRDYRYRAWIRTLPSAVSGQAGCEAAHTGTGGGMRQKASDYSCIPLIPEEHLEYHTIGKKDFYLKYGLDVEGLVKRLNDLWFRGMRSWE